MTAFLIRATSILSEEITVRYGYVQVAPCIGGSLLAERNVLSPLVAVGVSTKVSKFLSDLASRFGCRAVYIVNRARAARDSGRS